MKMRLIFVRSSLLFEQWTQKNGSPDKKLHSGGIKKIDLDMPKTLFQQKPGRWNGMKNAVERTSYPGHPIDTALGDHKNARFYQGLF